MHSRRILTIIFSIAAIIFCFQPWFHTDAYLPNVAYIKSSLPRVMDATSLVFGLIIIVSFILPAIFSAIFGNRRQVLPLKRRIFVIIPASLATGLTIWSLLYASSIPFVEIEFRYGIYLTILSGFSLIICQINFKNSEKIVDSTDQELIDSDPIEVHRDEIR